MIRVFAVLLLLVPGAIVLAAPSEESAAGAEAMEPIELELMDFAGWAVDVFAEAIEDYNALTPNVTITQTSLPGSAAVNDQLLVRIAGGNPPDIAWVIAAFAVSLANQGGLLALDPYMEAAGWDTSDPGYGRFYDFAAQSFVLDGKLYGVPGSVNPFAIGYNKEMFLDAGLPTPLELAEAGNWTWDTFLESAKALTGGEGADRVFGYAARWRPWLLAMRVWQNGGDFWNEDKTATRLHEPEAVEAIQWYFDLHLKHGVAPEMVSTASHGGLFQAGQVAMIDQGPAGRGAFMDLPFTFELAPQPTKVRSVSWAGGGSLVMPVGQEHPEEAFKFIEYFFSAPGISTMLRNGGPGTAVVDGMNTPDFLYSPPTNPEIWIQSLPTAEPVPWIVRNTDFLNILTEQIDRVAIGDQTAAEAGAIMQPLLDDLVRP